MLRTVEATVNPDGTVRLDEPVELSGPVRALVTLLDAPVDEVTLLSEGALSDWNRPEEDEAWAHLQRPTSS